MTLGDSVVLSIAFLRMLGVFVLDILLSHFFWFFFERHTQVGTLGIIQNSLQIEHTD